MKFNRFLIFLTLSVMLISAFQNCSQNIQVTDQSSQLKILSQDTPPTGNSNLPSPTGTTPSPDNPFIPGPGIVLLPIQGEWASIAYEDNISDPDAGDRDFNDAVFNFRIAEQFNSQSQLIKIFIEVRLREKLSASNHILSLSLDGNPSRFYDNIGFQSAAAYEGAAQVKVIYEDGIVQTLDSLNSSLVEVFSSTSSRKNEVVKLEITLQQPELNYQFRPESVDYRKYRFILANHGDEKTGIDIAEINSTDEMLSNGNNYPFGFMIPTDWMPPEESQLIDKAYPKFKLYRDWLALPDRPAATDEILNWFVN